MKTIIRDASKDGEWHALSINTVFEKLESSAGGLTLTEAQRREGIFGQNELLQVKPTPALFRFLLQFHNVLVYVLFVAAVISALLSHWIEVVVILFATVVNAVVGFIQEGKAEKAIQSVRDMLSPQATVIRQGRRHSIPAKLLVPGDVVLLQSGDKIPADLRLFAVKNLQVQEAILTGESLPVMKQSKAVRHDASIIDRNSMGYSGTLVVSGRGQGIVVATGQSTELGRITELVAHIPALTTPLLKQISRFAYGLSLAILFLAFVTCFIGVFFWHVPLIEIFIAAVGLAVAAIPEGLPATLTIIFAVGVTRMARRNAIVRRLPVIETMGSVNIICTDKTGTLTKNELSVRRVVIAEQDYQVTGSGYNVPLGEHTDLKDLIRAALLCNDAELLQQQDHFIMNGNPVDGALLSLGLKAKFDLNFEQKTYPRTDLIPFESEHKLMASLHHDHQGQGFIFVKGAPELILKRCSRERFHRNDRSVDHEYWHKKIKELTDQGQRVVAIAVRKTMSDHRELMFDDIKNELTLLGLVGLIDPPRADAIKAITQCQQAGIRVKMITGDHARTALAVSKQIGLINTADVLTGQEIDALSDEELRDRAEGIDVYARTSPEHKLRLVRALQSRHYVVAMTGDGVNDAPALKQANIGVAMGHKGTDATREVSEVVLSDDNFTSIYSAVKEGRTVYDNLKKAILFTLPTNFGEAGMIIIAVLLGYVLPITALQILWINLITEVTLSLALSLEFSEPNIMQRPPRALKEPILSKLLIWRIIYVVFLMLVCGFGAFLYETHWGESLAVTRTVVVNVIVFAEIAYLFNCRNISSSGITIKNIFGSIPVLLSVWVTIIFQLVFTYAPFMQKFFDTRAISLAQWGLIAALNVGLFFFVELDKIIIRFFSKKLNISFENRNKPLDKPS